MKLKVSMHPVMIVLIILAAFYGYFFLVLSYLIVIFLHELAHAVVAKRFGYKLNNITLMPYGAGISGQAQGMLASHEIVIALAGPACNIVLGVFTTALWWVFPTTYYYTEYFALANWVTAVINLFPVFPLDGGRVALSLLSMRYSRKRALTILKITGFVFSGVLIACFTLSSFFVVNYSFLLMGGFLLMSTIFDMPKGVYARDLYALKKRSVLGKGIKVRQIAVEANAPVGTLLKFINNHSITEFRVYSCEHKLVGTLTEFQLYKVAEKTSSNTPISALFVKNRGF